MKSTVFLPRTNFVARVKSTERAACDTRLAALGNLHGFYDWQLRGRRDAKSLPKFLLLDGPPYANGAAHVGHAINKVLKDFMVKSRALAAGHRVEYRPGWDCHGLPIELAIRRREASSCTHAPSASTSSSSSVMTGIENAMALRHEAAALAQQSIDAQMSAFRKWGVAADWSNYYSTMHSDYVAKQLRIFARLYELGFVYRAYKPVYWSPSSRTALAESELEYNAEHKSLGVYFRFQLVNFDITRFGLTSTPRHPVHVYALTWTTTPWTLPLNNAVAYAPQMRYALVEFDAKPRKSIRDVFLVGWPLLERLRAELSSRLGEMRVLHDDVSSSALKDVFYRCSTYNELCRPMLAADFVGADKGTGLVHCSYAHGFDDYKLAVARGDPVECFVDESGAYGPRLGARLSGRSVFADSGFAAIDVLRRDVVHTHEYTHSYPYDWRTKQPVIIRASEQWFIDVSEVGRRAAELLIKNDVKIAGGLHDQSSALQAQLRNRPAWCISRQRLWGVPIPCAVARSTGRVVTSGAFIRFIADLVAEKGSTDVWWQLTAKELFNYSSCPREFLDGSPDSFEKGADIMDVWLDSGVAWHTLAHNPDAIRGSSSDCDHSQADAIVEGKDQLRGWFQSLLLTSVAARSVLPFKRVFVHGFAVDDNDHKMSKSLGNVMLPDAVTDGTLHRPALGVDGLRLWVALHGAECVSDARIGAAALADIERRIAQIRLIFRFILGALDGWQVGDKHASAEFTALDKYILLKTKYFVEQCILDYENFRFRTVANNFIQFLQNPLSSLYFNCVRDRLYCDRRGSPAHNAARQTLDRVGRAVCAVVAPLLPHMAIEFYAHHPEFGESQCSEALRQPLSDILQTLVSSGFGFRESASAEQLQKEECELINLVERCVLDIRTQIFDGGVSNSELDSVLSEQSQKKKVKTIDLRKKGVVIHAAQDSYKLLQKANRTSSTSKSDLIELLGVSRVELHCLEEKDAHSDPNVLRVHAHVVDVPGTHHYCVRCRRMTRIVVDNADVAVKVNESKVCARCDDAISKLP